MKARWSWQAILLQKSGPVLLLLLAGAASGVAAMRMAPQVASAPVSRPTLPASGEAGDSHDPFAEQAASKMTHLREDERRKRLITDTAKLVALTNELKAEVDNTSRDELSLDVIRKATEIEKLAHDVRERMKN